MIIVEKKMNIKELQNILGEFFDDMIKGVVDIEKGTLAINADLHADLETMLVEKGSNHENLWGINLFPGKTKEDFIVFDSLINIKPAQNNRSRTVESDAIKKQITEIVNGKIEW